jgi:LEA14-like dessication related protein
VADTSNILPIGLGAALLGYIVMNQSKHKTNQEYANLDIAIAGVHADGLEVLMTVKVLNPNSIAMEIQSFVGSMYVGSQQVAKLQMFGDYIAKPNASISFDIICKPIVANLYSTFGKKLRGLQIMFKGTINVNNNAIPLTVKYTR